ncbi:hypothetical protein [Marinobacter sp. C2H3]|uniref:hypothetical protein n=1 Tax=Marinobacter sp. C2H3 TaxID=3119003 RepID=UPI00300F513A
MMDRLFKDRESAGQALGEALKARHLPANTLILSLEMDILNLRKRGAAPVLVAVPVGPQGTAERFADIADGCVCLLEPVVFNSVGLWYLDFHQVTEEQVLEALGNSHPGQPTQNHLFQGPGRG